MYLIKISEITSEEAINLAKKAFSEKGWDIEKFVIMMEDYSDKWIIIFKAKLPPPGLEGEMREQPPGDEMKIHISKKDGSIKVFMEE